MKRKSDPPKARAGLIKSFELKRRKQSENSNRVPAKSLGDGTAVAAGAPANAAELPPACSRAPYGSSAPRRGLFVREACLKTPARLPRSRRMHVSYAGEGNFKPLPFQPNMFLRRRKVLSTPLQQLPFGH